MADHLRWLRLVANRAAHKKSVGDHQLQLVRKRLDVFGGVMPGTPNTGRRILRKKLIGPALNDWYPQHVRLVKNLAYRHAPKGINKAFKGLGVWYDEEFEEKKAFKAFKGGYLVPRKGTGSRATKKKK
ncbi:MAG: hypothetical protein MHM6MM_003834 [Cercozoa sp. M6MM]